MLSNRLIILDRDGVINEDSPRSIRSLDEWIPIRGSMEAIARLCGRGWRVAVATNQSGIARGYLTPTVLVDIHHALVARAVEAGGRIDVIAVCPHAPEDGCACRKPGTELLAEIERKTGLSAQGAPFVGDSMRDIEAAQRFGCVPVLVRTGNGSEVEAEAKAVGVKHVFDDLSAAVEWLIQR